MPAAPGDPGRRSPFAMLVLLAGFLLLAPSIFLLAPLALLLLVSRPSSAREWFWLALCAVGIWAVLQRRDALLDQMNAAYAVFFAGGFVVLTLAGVRSLVTRGLAAASVAAAAVAACCVRLGVDFPDLRDAVVAQTWSAYRDVWPDLPATPPSTGGPDLVGGTGAREFAQQLADGVASVGIFTPGFLTLVMLAGAWLAWSLYHRVARRPLGAPAPPFRAFRFNDHLIWALVVLAAVALLVPPSPVWSPLVANLLFVFGGLYAARGLAVAQTALARAPLLFAILVYVLAFPVLPFALLAIGVADTWLDLRRRLTPPQGVSS